MQKLMEELFELYEGKRAEFVGEIQQDKAGWRENLKWSSAPKLEALIEKESQFYNEILSDIAGLSKLKNKSIDKLEWQRLSTVMKNHNERLACRVDNNAVFAAFIALAGAIFMFGSQMLTNKYFLPFTTGALLATIWAGGQIFLVSVKDRHALSRNRELIRIIDSYLKQGDTRNLGFQNSLHNIQGEQNNLNAASCADADASQL